MYVKREKSEKNIYHESNDHNKVDTVKLISM